MCSWGWSFGLRVSQSGVLIRALIRSFHGLSSEIYGSGLSQALGHRMSQMLWPCPLGRNGLPAPGPGLQWTRDIPSHVILEAAQCGGCSGVCTPTSFPASAGLSLQICKLGMEWD